MTNAEAPPRVLVVGTGAMACLFGARLSRSGRAQVTLAGSWEDGLRALREHGIRLQETDRDEAVRVGVRHLHEAAEPVDYALVLVKSHQTAAVAPFVARALRPEGLAVTLQNGLGNGEALEAVVGRGRVGVGVVTVGATLAAPAHVRATPGAVVLGAYPARMQELAALLSAASFAVSVQGNLDGLVWRKLAVNCAINPLSALEGRRNGQLLETPALRPTLVKAAIEVAAVAAAKGIEIGVDPAELVVSVARETASNRSSMLQDVDRGAQTEIDALNGAVVREARALGVPVPVNEALWGAVLASNAPRAGAAAASRSMKTVETISAVRSWRRSLRGSVGLVPTMGALHQGHLSLVRRARAECDHVAASLFVNPTQFGPREDLSRYPRDLPRDRRLLEETGCDLLFAPSPAEMYPEGFDTRVEPGAVAAPLEGERRPGHFAGVATVVLKLFHVFEPTRAYFGQKDAQQLAVIRKMAKDLDVNVELVACDTVREPDGLALSSRNAYLSPEERAAAPVVYHALEAARKRFDAGERDAASLREAMLEVLAAEPLAKPDYVSVADPLTLRELERAEEGALVSLAVRFGGTRLIDNVVLP
jgi:pantoate--beta-alanine ligase